MFIPYLTAFVLVFSGMAIGYFLWHNESTEDDALREEMLRQTEQLKKTLSTAQTSYSTLDDRFTRQRGQLNVLQKLCDDWSKNREEADRERVELEVQFNERSQRCDQLTAELQALKEKSLKLEDTLHNNTQTQLTKLTDVEGGWHKKFSKTESLMLHYQSDVKTLKSEKEATLKKLNRAEAKVAELEAELKSTTMTIETAKGSVQGLEKEHVSLESGLQHTRELLKKAEIQTAAERSEKESLKESLTASQNQCARLQGQIETLQDEIAEKATYKQKSDSLVLSLGNANGQLEKVLAQRDSALTSYSTAQTVAKGLQARIDNQEQTIHHLRKSQDDALENLKHELKIRSEIETKFDVRLKELRDQLDKEDAQKTGLVSELRDQLKQSKAEIVRLQQQNETIAKVQQQDFDAELEMLHEVAETELLDLKKQLDTANAQFEKTKQKHVGEMQSLQQTLRQREVEVQSFAVVQQELSEKELQLSQLASSIDEKSKDYSKTIVKLNTQREQLQSDLETAREQMKAQLKQDSETIGLLQGERNELRTEVEELNSKIGELQSSMVHLEKTSHQYEADSKLIETSLNRMKELEKALEKKDNALKHLQAESNELSRLRDEHAATLRRQAELQSRLDSMMAEHLSSTNRHEDREQEVVRLQQQLLQSEATIAKLRTQRTEMLNEMATQRGDFEDAAVISFTQAMKQRSEASFNPEYGGIVRMDSTRGLVFTEAPETKDDLKLISGIATVLESRLNEFGIYTFKQIMEWKPNEIEEFSRLLTFKERIVRDDWQGQARFFYNKKKKKGSMQAA